MAAPYIDTNVFNTLVIYKTLEAICLNAVEEQNDKWNIRYNYYAECYATEFSNFSLAYDRNEDGNISDDEDANRPVFNTITINRGNANC